MYQLDDKFLDDLGLGGLPEDQKQPFLQHIYNELEMRVGTRLSEGLTDEQLDEFEAIIDHKDEVVNPWMERFAPDYQQQEAFRRLVTELNIPADSQHAKAEYAATRWLELNRPNYRQVVNETLEGLKSEIIGSRDVILGAQNQS
jgi:hypothetical protein